MEFISECLFKQTTCSQVLNFTEINICSGTFKGARGSTVLMKYVVVNHNKVSLAVVELSVW